MTEAAQTTETEITTNFAACAYNRLEYPGVGDLLKLEAVKDQLTDIMNFSCKSWVDTYEVMQCNLETFGIKGIVGSKEWTIGLNKLFETNASTLTMLAAYYILACTANLELDLGGLETALAKDVRDKMDFDIGTIGAAVTKCLIHCYVMGMIEPETFYTALGQ